MGRRMSATLEDRMRNFLLFAIPAIGGLVILGAVVWGAKRLADYGLEQERLSQQRCLERGGKITQYAGGFTSWACEGMTKL